MRLLKDIASKLSRIQWFCPTCLIDSLQATNRTLDPFGSIRLRMHKGASDFVSGKYSRRTRPKGKMPSSLTNEKAQLYEIKKVEKYGKESSRSWRPY